MNFIILGDKFQKRMKSKGCVGLLKINNRSIVEHQYTSIRKIFPKANIIYVSGFEHKKLCSFLIKNKLDKDIHITYNPNYEIHNQGYSLYLVKQFFNTDCCILSGDNIINSKIFDNFNYNTSKIFINQHQKNQLGCIINQGEVHNIAYGLDNYLYEMYYLSQRHSIILQKIINSSKYYNTFLFELINKLIDFDQKIYPHIIKHKPLSLGNITI